MKTAKLGATIVLLLFVGATVGMLIAQEVSQPKAEIIKSDGNLGPAAEAIASAPESSSGESIPEVSSAGGPVSTVDTANTVNPGPEANEGDVGVSTVQPVTSTPCVIDAIYFHNTFRCATCLKIESEAKAIVEAEFAEELAAGKLRWSAINMEEQRAYISQYDLAMPSLVLVRRVGDEALEWIALDDTWGLIRSETRFSKYIGDSVRAFLEGCP